MLCVLFKEKTHPCEDKSFYGHMNRAIWLSGLPLPSTVCQSKKVNAIHLIWFIWRCSSDKWTSAFSNNSKVPWHSIARPGFRECHPCNRRPHYVPVGFCWKLQSKQVETRNGQFWAVPHQEITWSNAFFQTLFWPGFFGKNFIHVDHMVIWWNWVAYDSNQRMKTMQNAWTRITYSKNIVCFNKCWMRFCFSKCFQFQAPGEVETNLECNALMKSKPF